MKTLLVLISILFFVACGGAGPVVCKTNQDCHTGEKCVQGMCEDQTCWSSADCVTSHGNGWVCDLTTGQCVEKPECTTDQECKIQDSTLRCIDYKCQPYTAKDSCYNQPCTGACSSCGNLTSCEDGTCQDSCHVWMDLRMNDLDKACQGESNVCWLCHCWNLNRQIGNEKSCELYVGTGNFYTYCTEESSPGDKVKVATTDWTNGPTLDQSSTSAARAECENVHDYP